MPDRAGFAFELGRIIGHAEEKGSAHIDVNSGDLHRRVGGYPGHDHRMPVCCDVMRSYMDSRDTILSEPPKEDGATVVIRYALPR